MYCSSVSMKLEGAVIVSFLSDFSWKKNIKLETKFQKNRGIFMIFRIFRVIKVRIFLFYSNDHLRQLYVCFNIELKVYPTAIWIKGKQSWYDQMVFSSIQGREFIFFSDVKGTQKYIIKIRFLITYLN